MRVFDLAIRAEKYSFMIKQILTLSEPDLPTTLFHSFPIRDRDLKGT